MKKFKLNILIGLALVGLFFGASPVFAGPDVKCDSAVIYGTIFPNGNTIEAWFEWGTSRSTVENGGGTKTSIRRISSAREINENLTGLSENTTYYYRLVTKVENRINPATTEQFTTSFCPVLDPTVNISASPTNISYGGDSVISWSSTNATSCVASGGANGWAGNKKTNGSFNTGQLSSSTTFNITCQNSIGVSESDSVRIEVSPLQIKPTVSLSAKKTSVNYNESTYITWSSSHASSCYASSGTNGWAGIKETSGTFPTGSLTTDTTYSIYCTGAGGTSSTRTIQIYVSEMSLPVSVNISASQTTIPYGGSTTISWSSSNAISCVASGGINGWGGSRHTSGGFYASNITKNSTFSITCSNGLGETATDSVTINVINTPIATVNLTADDTSLSYNNSGTILRWTTSENIVSCSANGPNPWSGSRSASGGQYNTGSLKATTNFYITCYDNSGKTVSDSVKISVDSAPVIEATGALTLSPSSCIIESGENTCEVHATWTTQNTTNPSLVNIDTGSTLSDDSYRYSYHPLNVSVSYPSTTFQLRNGSTVLDSKTASASCISGTYWNNSACVPIVDNNPVVEIFASPSSITSGNSSLISWNSYNTSYCNATGGVNGWAGSRNTSGNFSTGPMYNTATFNIVCFNGTGQQTNDSITVNVNNNNNFDDEYTPDVSTRSAINIDEDSATLRGYVSSNGNNNNTRAWFEWGTSSGSYSHQTSRISYGSTSGSYYEYTIYGLDSDKTYYYRAVAQNDNGETVYGSRQSFRTDDDDDDDDDDDEDRPDVTTESATSVTDSRAVLNGYVDPNGSSTSTWFEWGTSYSNLNRTTSKDSQGTRRDDFEESISGLSPNTIYYFRAIARNSEGTERGNILSFVTSGSGYITPQVDSCAYGNCTPSAVTSMASNVTQTSAQINGFATISNNSYSSGYFEYGKTVALGLYTQERSIGNVSSVPFSETLSNLSPNTIYYFRMVVKNQYGISRGNILTFRTGNFIVYNDTTTGTNVVYRNTTVVSNSTTSTGNSRPSLVMLTISGDEEIIRRGNFVDYIVEYENISSKDLKNVVLRVAIPGELEFVETTKGSYSEEDNMVVVGIGDLSQGEDGSVRITSVVKTSSEIGKTVVIPANLAYTISNTGEQEEVFAYSRNTIGEERLGGLGANAIFGTGFLPNTLLGWLLLILLILLLVAAVRWLYEKSGTKAVPAN